MPHTAQAHGSFDLPITLPWAVSDMVNSDHELPHCSHVSPSVAKLTSFPAKLTSFPFLIGLLNWMGSENTADTVYLYSAKGMIRSRGLSVARMAKKSNRQGR